MEPFRILKSRLLTALHSLGRVPLFAGTVILVLAASLGALLTTFSLCYALLWKPLPYSQADEIQVLESYFLTDTGAVPVSSPQFERTWYQRQDVFSAMALVSQPSGLVDWNQGNERLFITHTTQEYFSLLDVPLRMGRFFTPQEQVDRAPVALISERLWRDKYNAQADILQHSLQTGEQDYRIIGVVAQQFVPPALPNMQNRDGRTDVWLPWLFPTEQFFFTLSSNPTNMLVRIKPGVTPLQAQDQIAALAKEFLIEIYANEEDLRLEFDFRFRGLREAITGSSGKVALLLFSAAALVCLIACANIASLFFSRAVELQHSLAVRAAAGAKPKDLLSTVWLESMLLCGIGACGGWLLAAWGQRLFQAFGRNFFPALDSLALNFPALLFVLALALVLAWVFSQLTLRPLNYLNLGAQLQQSGKGGAPQVATRSLKLLVGGQATLAGILLLAASLVLSNALQIINLPLGYERKDLYSLFIQTPSAYTHTQQSLSDEQGLQRRFAEDLAAAIGDIPGVARVARTSLPPLSEQFPHPQPLRNLAGEGSGYFAEANADAELFATLGLRLIAGRNFTAAEVTDQARVMVVSESAAADLAPEGDDILGKTFVHWDDPTQIIGVVSDVLNPAVIKQPGASQALLWLPYIGGSEFFSLIVRMQPGQPLRRSYIDTALAHFNLKPEAVWLEAVGDRYGRMVATKKLVSWLTLALTMLALLLAASGVYGVLNYHSQMRRFEAGIRLAMGAKTGQVMAHSLGQFLLPIVGGLLLSGLLGALGYGIARQYIAAWLGINWALLGGALLLLGITALMACYLPVRALLRNDPIKALHNE